MNGTSIDLNFLIDSPLIIGASITGTVLCASSIFLGLCCCSLVIGWMICRKLKNRQNKGYNYGTGYATKEDELEDQVMKTEHSALAQPQNPQKVTEKSEEILNTQISLRGTSFSLQKPVFEIGRVHRRYYLVSSSVGHKNAKYLLKVSSKLSEKCINNEKTKKIFITFMKRVSTHPFMVGAPLVDFSLFQNRAYVVRPFAALGSLSDVIHSLKPLTPHQKKQKTIEDKRSAFEKTIQRRMKDKKIERIEKDKTKQIIEKIGLKRNAKLDSDQLARFGRQILLQILSLERIGYPAYTTITTNNVLVLQQDEEDNETMRANYFNAYEDEMSPKTPEGDSAKHSHAGGLFWRTPSNSKWFCKFSDLENAFLGFDTPYKRFFDNYPNIDKNVLAFTAIFYEMCTGFPMKDTFDQLSLEFLINCPQDLQFLFLVIFESKNAGKIKTEDVLKIFVFEKVKNEVLEYLASKPVIETTNPQIESFLKKTRSDYIPTPSLENLVDLAMTKKKRPFEETSSNYKNSNSLYP